MNKYTYSTFIRIVPTTSGTKIMVINVNMIYFLIIQVV